jgi:hypothetical protein
MVYSEDMADEKPKQYGEPQRSLRVSKEIWDAARERAYRERTSVNAVVVAFLAKYGADMPPLPGATERAPSQKPRRKRAPDPDAGLAVASDPRAAIRKLPALR